MFAPFPFPSGLEAGGQVDSAMMVTYKMHSGWHADDSATCVAQGEFLMMIPCGSPGPRKSLSGFAGQYGTDSNLNHAVAPNHRPPPHGASKLNLGCPLLISTAVKRSAFSVP